MQPEQLKKIGRAATQCLACGAHLADVARHPSALREPSAADDEEEAFQREDFCPDCWRDIARDGYLSFWLVRREPPKIAARLTRRRRNESLLAYFVRLDGVVRREIGETGEGGSGTAQPAAEAEEEPQPALAAASVAVPLPPAVADESAGRRQRRQALRVRLFILAHLLHYYHVLEWLGEAPHPASARKTLLRFRSAALEREFAIEAVTPDPQAVEAVRNELKHYLETTTDVLQGVA